MEKIALITDSTCGVPKKYVDKYNIHVARLKIVYKDKDYIDGVDITDDEVYSKLDIELPTTSMPSVYDINLLYENLFKEGYTHAIVLPISSGLSGTINSFRLASEQFEDKITTFIYDTKSISIGVGLAVMEVGKLIEEGKTFDDICITLPKIKEKTSLYFTVDTLEYLIKGGRIGRISGGLGEMLNLKPIITMGEDGKYITSSKVRGTKQAFNKLEKLSLELLNKGKCKVVVMTGTMKEEAENLKNILCKHTNTTFMHLGTLTPVVGIHSGPRLLGVAILEEF